jgi:hypothetical protein
VLPISYISAQTDVRFSPYSSTTLPNVSCSRSTDSFLRVSTNASSVNLKLNRAEFCSQKSSFW